MKERQKEEEAMYMEERYTQRLVTEERLKCSMLYFVLVVSRRGAGGEGEVGRRKKDIENQSSDVYS